MIDARAFGDTPGLSLANRRAREIGTAFEVERPDPVFDPSGVRDAASDKQVFGYAVLALCFLSVTYNAILAILNTKVQPLDSTVVIGSEMLLLAAALGLIVTSGFLKKDAQAFAFLAFFAVNFIAISLLSQHVFVDMIRNTAIIALFFMLGLRSNWRTVKAVFGLVSFAVGAVLALEMFSTEAFASIFSPAEYFSNTRGIGTFSGDEPALFGNTQLWAGRFSISQIIDHRASSLFLEQVSLGNFAVILAIFLSCTWERHSWIERALYISLVVLLVLTTASRAALALTLIAPLIRWVGPKLAAWSHLLVMPAALGIATAIVWSFPPTLEDNLVGRLGYTIQNLEEISIQAIAGMESAAARGYADSGYVFLIYGSSILGLLAFWLFTAFLLRGASDLAKRCALYTTLYVFACLLVSGTSVFSVKTAVLLWLFVGFSQRLSENAE